MITNNLKKRFCRDMSINIQLYSEPYFSDRVKLLGFEDDWNALVEDIETNYNGNEEAFLEEYNVLKDKVIDFIQNSEAFKSLNKADMNEFSVTSDITTKDVYKHTNIGEEFISIDIAKANFSSIVLYAISNNLDFADTRFNYERFMRKFTDKEYFIKSKYIRQVIFGACNPKRQVTYQKYIMNQVLNAVLNCSAVDITKEDIVSFSHDEIVIRVNDKIKGKIEYLKALLIVLGSSIPLHFEYFKLGKVVMDSEAFIKEIYFKNTLMEPSSYANDEEANSNINGSLTLQSSGRYEIKKANPIETVFIHRLLNNEDIQEDDLIFYYEGKLAKLLDKPNLAISFTK